MAAAKNPVARLAELALEEEIIRDNYMYGVTNPRVVITIVERLNEIQVEREYIQRKMKQDKELAQRKRPETSTPASRSLTKKPAHHITPKKGAPKHGQRRPPTIQLFLVLVFLSIVMFYVIR